MTPHTYSIWYRQQPLAEWELQGYFYANPNDATFILNHYRAFPKDWYFPPVLPQWQMFDHNTRTWYQ